MLLLQDVAGRVVARWLAERGKLDVQAATGREALDGRAVDLTYAWQGSRHKIKLKPDPYFGTEPGKIADRFLTFYRADASAYAFESIANSATREQGWVSGSDADELFYYRLALSQTEEEIRGHYERARRSVFSELEVDRDELVTMPMAAARAWFDSHADNYQARPVIVGGVAAWYRLVPRADVESAVQGLKIAGPVFRSLST